MSGTLVIRDRSHRNEGWTDIGCATLGAGFGVGVTMLLAAELAHPDRFDPVGFPVSLLFMGFGSLAAVGGTVEVFLGFRRLWLGHVLGVPKLVVPSVPLLCLGAVVVARFVRSGGSQRVTGTPRLTAELICQESANDTGAYERVTREVYRRDLAVQVDPAPGTVAGQIEIAVPLDAPPSMRLSNNRIQWSVNVHVQVPGLPDDTGTFKLQVQPVVADPVLAREPGAPR
jgi:hypothetical protein